MSQDIELEDVLIDIVEVKVGGLPFSCHIICRILDRSKVIDIHIVWNNNDSPRVLTGRPFDPSCAKSQALDLGIPVVLAIVPLITLDKAVGSLSCDRTYRSCPEGIFFPKDIPDIQVGTRLVFPREVQIDIGYLVPIETKEGFKRNILAIFAELVATVWTILVWHIKTRSIRTVCDELTVLALATNIVRRKRINLGDPNHGRDKAGSNGSTRSNQVAPLIGTVHQHLRCQINHGKAIPQDGG